MCLNLGTIYLPSLCAQCIKHAKCCHVHERAHIKSSKCHLYEKHLMKQFLTFVVNFQANPDPSTCLGVFGLSLYTTERDLREVFSRYGPLAGVNVVYDQRTGRSRGFAFVYFERLEDSKEV